MRHDEQASISTRSRAISLAAAAVAGTALIALSACNTVSGAGRDLQEASDNVKDAINDDASKD